VLPRALGRHLARAFTRSQCRHVDALIVPSEPMRALLAQYGVATPLHVLPTGLPPACFRAGVGARFRQLFDLPAERPLLLYVGRVAHEKNIEFLIHAFGHVRRTLPAAMLVIAGEGPAQKALRQCAARLGLEGHVRFVGYLEREHALLDCYAAADVFVFASRTETQGLVLLEAMAQGAPVVSTAELGTRSVLTPESGAIVVPEQTQAFAAAVSRVLGDASLAHSLAARSRAYARTWSSAAMAGRLAQLYAEVHARHASARPDLKFEARAAAQPASAPGDTRARADSAR
jgi:glycosyltransferase involved in cell wall biosynthesis